MLSGFTCVKPKFRSRYVGDWALMPHGPKREDDAVAYGSRVNPTHEFLTTYAFHARTTTASMSSNWISCTLLCVFLYVRLSWHWQFLLIFRTTVLVCSPSLRHSHTYFTELFFIDSVYFHTLSVSHVFGFSLMASYFLRAFPFCVVLFFSHYLYQNRVSSVTLHGHEGTEMKKYKRRIQRTEPSLQQLNCKSSTRISPKQQLSCGSRWTEDASALVLKSKLCGTRRHEIFQATQQTCPSDQVHTGALRRRRKRRGCRRRRWWNRSTRLVKRGFKSEATVASG